MAESPGSTHTPVAGDEVPAQTEAGGAIADGVQAEVKDQNDNGAAVQHGEASWAGSTEDGAEAGPSRTNGAASTDADDLGEMHDDGIDPSDSVDPLDVMDEDEGGGEAIMSDDGDGGPAHEGKRVKVYELRDSSWFDRGTGYCKGIYDDSQDLALLIVESEEEGAKVEEGEGGFLKEELLLTARVEKEDIYVRQQDTLIVWTEPGTSLDIALSFQDCEGCEDIWQFIAEVQRHLNNLPADMQAPSSSSPLSASPMLGVASAQMGGAETRTTWEPPTLSNIKQQEMWLRMQAKSAQGRERAVEHIIGEDYIKQLTVVFEQAEDLESLDDLHALCSLMQTILMFNDNTLLEYILQDEIFMGVIGIFEYDPDFPSLKASYRQFFQDVAKFRQVVEIRDPSIRTKIHQLFRVQYLRDVVLARMLDDGTFGILNGFVFFTQVDIINYIQNNDVFLNELLSGFRDDRPSTPEPLSDTTTEEPLDEKRRDIVLLLNQLMVLGKGVQLPSRLALYRNLIDKGLLFAVEWAFRRSEAQLLHAGAEILTLAVELDVSAVRVHILKEDEAKRRSLVLEMIHLLGHTRNLGLLSQVGDSLRTLLDTSSDEGTFLQRKEGPISENFVQMFYENCVGRLYQPLLDLPDLRTAATKPKLPRERVALLHLLTELLAASVLNQSQLHRASYYVLSNPISKKVVSLLYLKDKPLRHAALRFIKSCLKLQNHFINRFFIKNELLLPVIDVLETESTRDNMLSSACMEVLDLIRKDNAKPIINHIFESHRARLEALGQRPYLRQLVFGLTVRWQQNNEPPPPPVQPEAESSKAWERKAQTQEDDYFNASDDEDEASPVIGPVQPASTVAVPASTPPKKRRRNNAQGSATTPNSASASSSATSPVSRPGAPSPGKMAAGGRSSGMGLVDYDDGSDSEGSSGAQSPVIKPLSAADMGSSPTTSAVASATPDDQLEEDLGDVAMKMRAKRAREEEEEEGFAGLLGKAKTHAGPGLNLDTAEGEMAGKPGVAKQGLEDEQAKGEAQGVAEGKEGKSKEEGGKSWSAAAGAGGKKLRLNFSGAFKKLSK